VNCYRQNGECLSSERVSTSERAFWTRSWTASVGEFAIDYPNFVIQTPQYKRVGIFSVLKVRKVQVMRFLDFRWTDNIVENFAEHFPNPRKDILIRRVHQHTATP
jgi:hypothetical protein